MTEHITITEPETRSVRFFLPWLPARFVRWIVVRLVACRLTRRSRWMIAQVDVDPARWGWKVRLHCCKVMTRYFVVGGRAYQMRIYRTVLEALTGRHGRAQAAIGPVTLSREAMEYWADRVALWEDDDDE